MSDYQTILTEVADKVATIWLNRPERRNAFSGEMTSELHEAFGRFEADDGVRAIVVTGVRASTSPPGRTWPPRRRHVRPAGRRGRRRGSAAAGRDGPSRAACAPRSSRR